MCACLLHSSSLFLSLPLSLFLFLFSSFFPIFLLFSFSSSLFLSFFLPFSVEESKGKEKRRSLFKEQKKGGKKKQKKGVTFELAFSAETTTKVKSCTKGTEKGGKLFFLFFFFQMLKVTKKRIFAPFAINVTMGEKVEKVTLSLNYSEGLIWPKKIGFSFI